MEWISVNDKLPELNNDSTHKFSNSQVEVLIHKDDGRIMSCFYFRRTISGKTVKSGFYSNPLINGSNYKIRNVTHWMPLPEPPGSVL